MINCLMENMAEPNFSEECREELEKREEQLKSDYRMDLGLVASCGVRRGEIGGEGGGREGREGEEGRIISFPNSPFFPSSTGRRGPLLRRGQDEAAWQLHRA